MVEKKIGKIENACFGISGYQEGQLGLHLEFTSGSYGMGTSKATWDAERISQSKHCKWSEQDRSIEYDEIMRFLSKTLNDANVNFVHELKGKAVELTIEGNTLKSWRILTEVL